MLKKGLAAFLCAALLTAAAAPAAAASEKLDEAMARVTAIVKQTLGIDDSYTDFSGNVEDEGAERYWDLNWSRDGERLSATADDNGKVFSYYANKDSDNSYYRYEMYAPSFPKAARADVRPAAEAFLKAVLGAGESYRFDDADDFYDPYDVTSYGFSGTVLLNGLKSPISFYISVRISDMGVSYFYRGDRYTQYVGDVPPASAEIAADAAKTLLDGRVRLKLRYVLAEDGKTAVLRYLPVNTGNYMVDALTGELVDLNALNDEFKERYDYGYMEGGMGGAAAEAPQASPSLSEAEQAAVAAMQGVLSKTDLDNAARAVTELGLDSGYQLNRASYTMSSDKSELQCQLSYNKKITDGDILKKMFPKDYESMKAADAAYPVYMYKYVTVDARTAQLFSVYSYNSASGEEGGVLDAAAMQAKAEAFLGAHFADKYALTALDDEDSAADTGSFVYAESVNGVLFPTNALYVTVSAYDGFVKSYSSSWTDGVAFAPAEGIVSGDDALAAYTGSFRAELEYVGVPAAVDPSDPILAKYEQYGYSYVYMLKLGYRHETDRAVSGVDAATGEPVFAEERQSGELAYTDLDGCYGRTQIETLAKYGIGFQSGAFRPTEGLTQRDALILLLGAVGYSYPENPTDEQINALYENAYYYGMLNRGERNPGGSVTRAGFVRMLIGATGYAKTAAVKDIFKSGFIDDTAIPAEAYGYVAIARGLGMIRGDAYGRFNPNNIITRQDAAIVLYNFMSI